MQVLVLGVAQTVADNRQLAALIASCEEHFRQPVRREAADSRAGQGLMEAYDVVQTPAVLVTRDDGTAMAIWQRSLPTFADVSYSFHS